MMEHQKPSSRPSASSSASSSSSSSSAAAAAAGATSATFSSPIIGIRGRRFRRPSHSVGDTPSHNTTISRTMSSSMLVNSDAEIAFRSPTPPKAPPKSQRIAMAGEGGPGSSLNKYQQPLPAISTESMDESVDISLLQSSIETINDKHDHVQLSSFSHAWSRSFGSIPSEPDIAAPNTVLLAVKLLDGRRRERRFLSENTLFQVMAWVEGESDEPFYDDKDDAYTIELFSNEVPLRVLPNLNNSLAIAGLRGRALLGVRRVYITDGSSRSSISTTKWVM